MSLFNRNRLKAALTIIAMLSFAVIAGCGFPNHAERKYLEKIEENQTSFRIPPSQFDTCWSRAKRFVTTYSSRPILEISDSVISSDKPSFFELMFESGYGYKVSANHIHDTSDIGIRVYCDSWIFNGSSAGRNGYILIDYIKTGILPFPELVSK